MKFCEVCNNMLYIRLTTGDTAQRLQYFCKNCGHATDGGDDPCVINTNYIDDQTTYKQHATPHLVHDPTLPRAHNIPCPNSECARTRPADAAPEVIFVKYDNVKLRYLYHCVHCGVFWKSGGAGPSTGADV